jgi:hypothetical protein
MFKDFGFLLLIGKEFLQGALTGAWFISLVAMHVAPNPWNTVAFVYSVAGLLFIFLPLFKSVLESKYEQYRKDKEEAWEKLKK